jgi:ABC-type amino acid transport substrate-binding protein
MGLHDQITFGFVNETHPVYLAFSSKHPKAVHFMEAFDRGMDIIHKNGTYQKILARYQNP